MFAIKRTQFNTARRYKNGVDDVKKDGNSIDKSLEVKDTIDEFGVSDMRDAVSIVGKQC